MNLSLKAKIATIFVFPVFIALLIAISGFTLITWIIIKLFQITGVIESLQYLFSLVQQQIKKRKFYDTLTPEDQKTMKNGKK